MLGMADPKEKQQATLLVKQKLNPILIVDPNAEFLESMYMDTQAQRIPPMAAQTPKEAQTIISQFKDPFAGLFVNPDIDNTEGMTIVRLFRQQHKLAPVIIIYDTGSKFLPSALGPTEMKKYGITQVIKKPITYSSMLKIATPTGLIFDPNDAIAISQKNTDQVDQEIAAHDEQFFGTLASNFLSGAKSFFDVYVRLSSGKYIKILKGGDSFTPERLKNYLDKGVTHFFMRKEVQQLYLNYSDKIAAAILHSPKLPERVKVSQTLHQGEQTMLYIKSTGMGEAGVQYATTFVQNVEALTKQLNLKNNDVIADFLKDLVAYEHGMSVVLIASLLMRTLNFEYGKAVNTVGLAALFHDLGLDSQSENVASEVEARMSDAEKKAFHNHPRTGAILLKNTKGVNPLVAQAVEQHHERRNRTGFPNALGPGAITLAAEIVGISDEIVHAVKRQATSSVKDPMADLEREQVFEGFSQSIIEAVKKSFTRPGSQ